MVTKRSKLVQSLGSIQVKSVTNKLNVDATKLFESMKYQIHVAMDYCHMLESGDVLWIEVYGDVSIMGKAQVEVKNFADALTDGHENFWNTLNNWLSSDFNHHQFANLILLTTQEFGDKTAFAEWNDLSTDERMETLTNILLRSEARFNEAKKRKDENLPAGQTASGPISPSKSLRLQRSTLHTNQRKSLMSLLPKIRILTEQPNLDGLIASYKRRYLKSILPNRQDAFLDDMFGFMTTARKILDGWKFEVGEFDKKFAELTSRYMSGSYLFPRIDSEAIKKEANKMDFSERLYVQKLTEIGGDQSDILKASRDLLHAKEYIREVIKDFTTSKEDIDDYRDDELTLHASKRKGAMVKLKKSSPEELKDASCAFYYERCAEIVTLLRGYDSTPAAFRNGIYHMLADEEPGDIKEEFHWRLWK